MRKTNLGIALLILGTILVFGKPQGLTEAPPNYTFESEPVSVQGFGEERVDENKLPERILIPDLSIDLPVKKAKIINGYWEVFSDSAGWGEGSGLPGKAGNQVIFAHVREGLFLPLKGVKEGMSVYVLTDDEWFSYEVEEIKEVFPNQTEVIAPTEDETLTLYTCSGFDDSKRLIVVAKRLSSE